MTSDELDDLWDQYRRLKGIEEGLYRVFDGYRMASDFAKEKYFTHFAQPQYMNDFVEILKKIDMTKFDVILTDVENKEERIRNQVKDSLMSRNGEDDE